MKHVNLNNSSWWDPTCFFLLFGKSQQDIGIYQSDFGFRWAIQTGVIISYWPNHDHHGPLPQDISFYFVFFEQGKKLANENGLYFLFK